MLLRGLSRGNGHWGDFPEYLKKKNVDIELMEIPGNGTTHQQTTPTDALEVISQIKAKSQFYQSKEKFNLCGISLGGMIALKWAEIFPEDLSSIAIVNSSLKQQSGFYQRMNYQKYPQVFKALLNKDPQIRQKIILSLISNHKDRADLYFDEFVKFSNENPVTLSNFIRQLILANKIKIQKKITTPVKVICSEQDQLVHFQCSLNIAEQLNVKAEIHPTAGHDLPLDAPEWLADILVN